MAQINRIYASQETASAVVKELQEHGFSSDAVQVVARPAEASTPGDADPSDAGPSGASPASEAIMASLTTAGIGPAAARVYAERISRGEVLVTVNPPFGYARLAEQILDSHDPVQVDVPEAASPAATSIAAPERLWDNPAPLSAALGLRVLLSDPTPLSNWLKRPTLKPEPATSTTLESIRRQSNDPAPLSGKLGLPTLSDNPAPLSTKAGWKLLSEKAAPLSEKLGWRVLKDDPAPLSSKLGWRTLSRDPTPLSSLLGLPVLLKR